MSVLNAREWAILIWLFIALSACLLHKDIRPQVFDVVKAFLNPKIIGPLILMTLYIWLEVRVAQKLGLWKPDLTKDTIVWAVTSGLMLFFKLDEVSLKPKFFRRRVFAAFKIAVFIEVFINLFVLSLPVELILQPLVVLIVALSAVAALNPDHKQVKKLMDGLLSIIGFLLLFFVTRHLLVNWNSINKTDLLLQLLLPVWLAIGLLPFVYILALYANYEMTFIRIGFFSKKWSDRLRAYIAVIIVLNLQARKVGAFGGTWLRKLAEAPSLRIALRVVREYRETVK